jgi:SAM-dependent methyltransferase
MSTVPNVITESINTCCFCGSQLGSEAFGSTYTDLWDNADGLRYSYFRCPSCHVHLLGNRPVFGPALVEFYAKRGLCACFDWQHPNPLIRNYTLRRQQRKLRILKRLVPLTQTMRILEVGCAKGSFAAVLKQEIGCEIHANDLDPSFARHMHPDVIFHGRPFDKDLPPGPNSYDVIISHHVIEHIYDPSTYFESCCHLLKSGGTMVLETPNTECATFRQFQADWIHVCAPRHVVLYSDRFFREELPRRFPFTKVEVHYDGNASDYDSFMNSAIHKLHLPVAHKLWAKIATLGLHLLLNPPGVLIERFAGCRAIMTVVATKG